MSPSPSAKLMFATWSTSALVAWKLKNKKLPEDERGEANYNGEIMLDSWVQSFRSCSEGAPGFVSYAPLRPIMEALACLHRNTTPTERSLKAIKSLDKHDAPEISLNHANDALIVKSHIAQDKTWLADESSVF